MSNDCKDTLQTRNKTVRVRRSRTSKVSIRMYICAALYRIRATLMNCTAFNMLRKQRLQTSTHSSAAAGYRCGDKYYSFVV